MAIGATEVFNLFGTIKVPTGPTLRAMGTLEKGAEKLARGFGASFQRMGGLIEQHAGAIRGVGAVLTGVGAAGVLMGRKLVGSAAQMEAYQAEFEVLTGSADAARERLDKLVKFAATTPFDLPGIIEADKLVQAFGLDLGGVGKTMTVFGDTAAAMGVPIEQVIRGFAKLQAGMFDMAEMAPLGITRDKLAELGVQFSKTGEVMNRDELFPAAIRLISRFGGTMEKVSETTGGRLSNLSDSFFQLSATIGDALTPQLKPLIDRVTAIADGVAAWAKEHPQLTASLVKVGTAIAAVAVAVGPLLIALPSLVSGLSVAGSIAGALCAAGGPLAALIGILSGPVGLAVAAAVAATAIGLKLVRAHKDEEKAARDAAEAERARTDSLISLAEKAQDLLEIHDRTEEQEEELRKALVELKGEYPELLRFYADEEFAAKSLIDVLEELRKNRESLLTPEEQAARRRQQYAKDNLLVILQQKAVVQAEINVLRAHLSALAEVGEGASSQYKETAASLGRYEAKLADLNSLLATTKKTVQEVTGGGGGGLSGATEEFTTRVDAAAELVAELEQELARLTRGTVAYGETLIELQAAQEDFNRLIGKPTDELEAIQPMLETWIKAWIQAFDAITEASRTFAKTVIGPAFVTEPAEVIGETAREPWQPYVAPVLVSQLEEMRERLKALYEEWQAASGDAREQIAADMRELQLEIYELERVGVEAAETTTTEISQLWLHTCERIHDAFAGVASRIRTEGGNLGDFFERLWEGILAAFDEMIGQMVADWLFGIEQMQKTGKLGGILGGVIGAIGGIFGFQHGGIVTQPTLAMLGERGPEAVIPLAQSAPAFAGAAAGPMLGGQTLVIENISLSADALDPLGVDRLGGRLLDAIGNRLRLGQFRHLADR